jgi:hypothetical protein
MEQRNDLILREIEKLSLFLTSLIFTSYEKKPKPLAVIHQIANP